MKKIFLIILIFLNSSLWSQIYDSNYFLSAERVVFVSENEAKISILPREEISLDLKISWLNNRLLNLELFEKKEFYGAREIEVTIKIPPEISSLTYQIEYKKSEEKEWKTIQRKVKIPGREDKIEIIFFGDDHLSDDADKSGDFIFDPLIRELRLSGDSVNYFLKELLKNPSFQPKGEWKILRNSFCFASTLYQIINRENPHLIFNLGDTGIGFGHRWEGLGLANQHLVNEIQIDLYEKIFRLAQRKMWSALSPNIPIYWVLGNHDGECGWNRTKEAGRKYREKYFWQPGEGNYFYLLFGNSEKTFIPVNSTDQKKPIVLFIVLDVMSYNYHLPKKPEDWTLGKEQREWFEKVLEIEADWKFVLAHHVLGGWPRGSTESELDYAYGRGPLFLEKDYQDFCKDPSKIEQVQLTKLMLENGVDAFIYGHDHIFHSKVIGLNSKGRKMRSICVGSTKYVGEKNGLQENNCNPFYFYLTNFKNILI